MARGWESKSVEAQQADREGEGRREQASITPEEAAARARRSALELARTRALADRAGAKHPAHKAMLDAAIAALDDQLRASRG